MSRKANASEGVSVRITVSRQSAELLNQIATMGIYGRNDAEVAARFVDKALQEFVQAPQITLRTVGQPK
jgi:hypothetical protein